MNENCLNKICGKCKKEYSFHNFSASKSAKDGLQSWCKECKAQYSKVYSKTDKFKQYQYKYNRSIKRKEFDKLRQASSEYKKYRKSYHKNRMSNDSEYRLKHLLKTSFVNRISRINKKHPTLYYLETSFADYYLYITKQLKEGMTWENYGSKYRIWEIDHKIPLIYFDFTVEEQVKNAWKKENLHPLFFEDHRKKGINIFPEHMYLIEKLKPLKYIKRTEA